MDNKKFNYIGGKIYVIADKLVAENGIVTYGIFLGVEFDTNTETVEVNFHMTVVQNEGAITLIDTDFKKVMAGNARDILLNTANQKICAVDRITVS